MPRTVVVLDGCQLRGRVDSRENRTLATMEINEEGAQRSMAIYDTCAKRRCLVAQDMGRFRETCTVQWPVIAAWRHLSDSSLVGLELLAISHAEQELRVPRSC